MHKEGSDAERDNKISRLQFLRWLGAGAVGYFAYRAGFINSLFDILQKPATLESLIGTIVQEIGM